MMRRLTGVVAGGLLAAGALWPPVAVAANAVHAVSVVSVPQSVTLGDRVPVTVKVASPALARSVQLQTLTKDLFGNLTWRTTATQHVKGVAKHTFRPVADQANTERFRAVVLYGTGTPRSVASKAVGVTVWSWTPLAAFSPYYATNGINGYEYTNFAMNGMQYLGWYTYGAYGSWEARYTTGRNCKAFRGDFGVQDNSADGSTGQITIQNVDDGTTLYQSATLTPGMVAKAQFNLPTPYRISVQAQSMSTDGLVAYPAIGVPEFLCTGL